jgi:molybdenum cofactor guanylyltransferase
MQKDSLLGLVVCGGLSSRMGTDKGMLNYHGQPQQYHLYELLSGLCDKVYISCNAEQSGSIQPRYQVIIDSEKYREIGPMGALLSAFEKHDTAALLVAGCDYPFIRENDLRLLENEANGTEFAVTYYNYVEKIREPLLGVYKSTCYDILRNFYELGDYSLNHFLKTVQAKTIIPENIQVIKSVDNMEEYQKALSLLKNFQL